MFYVYKQIDGALVLVRAGGVPVRIAALDELAALAVALAAYPRQHVAIGEVKRG